jgi:ankyrin repeat protein
MLLDAGAKVDSTLDDGYTALMTAAESSDKVELVELLLSRGADAQRSTPVDSQSAEASRKTAAELARRMKNDRVAEVIELWQSGSSSISAPVVAHEE